MFSLPPPFYGKLTTKNLTGTLYPANPVVDGIIPIALVSNIRLFTGVTEPVIDSVSVGGVSVSSISLHNTLMTATQVTESVTPSAVSVSSVALRNTLLTAQSTVEDVTVAAVSVSVISNKTRLVTANLVDESITATGISVSSISLHT